MYVTLRHVNLHTVYSTENSRLSQLLLTDKLANGDSAEPRAQSRQLHKTVEAKPAEDVALCKLHRYQKAKHDDDASPRNSAIFEPKTDGLSSM